MFPHKEVSQEFFNKYQWVLFDDIHADYKRLVRIVDKYDDYSKPMKDAPVWDDFSSYYCSIGSDEPEGLTRTINGIRTWKRELLKHKSKHPAIRLMKFVKTYLAKVNEPNLLIDDELIKDIIPKILIEGLTERHLREVDEGEILKQHEKPIVFQPPYKCTQHKPNVHRYVKYVKSAFYNLRRHDLSNVFDRPAFYFPAFEICKEIVSKLHVPLPKEFLHADPKIVAKKNVGEFRVVATNRNPACIVFECYLLSAVENISATPRRLKKYSKIVRHRCEREQVFTMDIVNAYNSCKIANVIKAQDQGWMKAYLSNLYNNSGWRYGLMPDSTLSDFAWAAYMKKMVGLYASFMFKDDICFLEEDMDNTDMVAKIFEHEGLQYRSKHTLHDREVTFAGVPVHKRDDAKFVQNHLDTLRSNMKVYLNHIGETNVSIEHLMIQFAKHSQKQLFKLNSGVHTIVHDDTDGTEILDTKRTVEVIKKLRENRHTKHFFAEYRSLY